MASCLECSTSKGGFILALDHIATNNLEFIKFSIVLLFLTFPPLFFFKQEERERANATTSYGFKRSNQREAKAQLMTFGNNVSILIPVGCCCINYCSKPDSSLLLSVIVADSVYSSYICIYFLFRFTMRIDCLLWQLRNKTVFCSSPSCQ